MKLFNEQSFIARSRLKKTSWEIKDGRLVRFKLPLEFFNSDDAFFSEYRRYNLDNIGDGETRKSLK